MIERVQQHHPSMGQVEIIRYLNDAMNDLGFRAELIESIDRFNTEAGKRVYPLKKHSMKVKGVDFDDNTIKKLIGRPTKRDLDL